jgi:hypothetical protein
MSNMTTYDLFWSPEGKRIATVQARNARAAKRKAPMPYRRYLGEIYAVSETADAQRWVRSHSGVYPQT